MSKKTKPKKVQLNTRVFESQRNALRVLQIVWGYSSLDRTVREVLRRFFRLNRESKELRAELNLAKEEIQRLQAQLEETKGRNHILEGWAHNAQIIRDIIEAFQDFKVEHFNWDRDLALAEIKHLDAYINYLQTGEITDSTVDFDDEEVHGLDEDEEED